MSFRFLTEKDKIELLKLIEEATGLPLVTEEDNDKVLTVVDGKWQAVDLPYTSEYPEYEGEYFVIPEVESQTLDTSNRVLTEDVTVDAIPYAEVSNSADGTTVTIG